MTNAFPKLPFYMTYYLSSAPWWIINALQEVEELLILFPYLLEYVYWHIYHFTFCSDKVLQYIDISK